LKDDAKLKLGATLSRREYKRILELDRAIISQRQAAEWGMGALQGQFGRLRTKLPINSKKRKLILKTIVLLYNYRCDRVGFNQIRTVFKNRE
jgi:hypothetical protein